MSRPSVAAKVFWCCVVLVAIAGVLAPAWGGELHLTVGKSVPTAYTEPVGVVSIGYRGQRYGIDATWVNEHDLKGMPVKVAAFALVSGYRHWTSSEVRWLAGGRVVGLLGLSVKAADRCARDGELYCNRELPLPFAFHFGGELKWGRKDDGLMVGVYHDSNDALDYGPEKKNLGFNWVSLRYWRAW